MLSRGVCVQRDNARPHAVRHTVKQIQDLKLGGAIPSALFTRFGIQQFSPLLPVEDAILECRFGLDDEVRQALYDWLTQ